MTLDYLHTSYLDQKYLPSERSETEFISLLHMPRRLLIYILHDFDCNYPIKNKFGPDKQANASLHYVSMDQNMGKMIHCMKSDFYVLYGSVKKVLCPLWPTVNGAFMFLYRKVAILNVSKDRFDHSSVYLGEMKLTPSVFLRQLTYTCSSEKCLEI